MEEDVAKSLYQVEPGKYRQYPVQDCNSNPSAYDTNVLENATTENFDDSVWTRKLPCVSFILVRSIFIVLP
jgi:hypothetical protein